MPEYAANPLYWSLLNNVGERTGVPGLLNTSFNRREPIVETPEEALNTMFYSQGIDVLAIGNFVVTKTEHLAPSILSVQDESTTRDSFRLATSEGATPEDWNLFWQALDALAARVGKDHLNYLDVFLVGQEQDERIIRIPLFREMFPKGHREKIVGSLVSRIEEAKGGRPHAVVAIEATDGNYSDVILSLFDRFTPRHLREQLHYTNLGYVKDQSTTKKQNQLSYDEAVDKLKRRAAELKAESREAPHLIAVGGPTASGKTTLVREVSSESLISIDVDRWVIPTDLRDRDLPFPYQQVAINDFITALNRLKNGQSAFVPMYFQELGDVLKVDLDEIKPISRVGFVQLSDQIAERYSDRKIKSDSQLWVRLEDGSVFEKVMPSSDDIFLLDASFALSFPILRDLIDESYYVETPVELRETYFMKRWRDGDRYPHIQEDEVLAKLRQAFANDDPMNMRGRQFADNIVSNTSSPVGETLSLDDVLGGKGEGSDNAQLANPGGIDLNPSMMAIESRGRGEVFTFEFEDQNSVTTNINGLVPIIINVTPINNIPLLIGENQSIEQERLSRLISD